MSERFRLPDGTTTTDTEAYVDAWRRLALPVETLTGWTLCAFDPTLSFDDGRATYEVTPFLAERIARLADERDAAVRVRDALEFLVLQYGFDEP